MNKLRKIFNLKANNPTKAPVGLEKAAPKPLTPAEREKFAKAVVRDYGETLVLLGKE